ncbi:hypothetical protein [Simkania sp.]|uniref:hypothetical protein n=1 Tax=Simkania sp. TaxID=34094 RepID=UPI003B520FA0
MRSQLIHMPRNVAARAGLDLAPQLTEDRWIAAHLIYLHIAESLVASSGTALDTAPDLQMLH